MKRESAKATNKCPDCGAMLKDGKCAGCGYAVAKAAEEDATPVQRRAAGLIRSLAKKFGLEGLLAHNADSLLDETGDATPTTGEDMKEGNTDLTKRLETAESELAKAQKDLKTAQDAATAAETRATAAETVAKGASDKMTALEAKITTLVEAVTKLTEAASDSAVTVLAKSLMPVGVPLPVEDVVLLLKAHGQDEAGQTKVKALLTKMAAIAASSPLFAVAGSTGAASAVSSEGENAAVRKINDIAKRHRDADPKLTSEQAVVKALEEAPHLYEEYTEAVKQRAA